MKKLTLFTTSAFLLTILSACNNTDEEKVTNVPNDVPVEQEGNSENETNGNNDAGESPYNFTSFDLDINYSGNKEYDVDYDNERTEMEAELKDDNAAINLKGDEAYEVLRPTFEQLTFDKDTADEEVISHVLEVFSLDEDYESFELEVKFTDGDEKEYKVTK